MGSDGEKQEQARPDSVGADSLPQERRNAIDYNNEIAGRETGRAKRFLASDSETSQKEKKREKQRAFNALMRAMQDPAYAKLYEEARDTVSRAQDATDRALHRLTRESEVAAQDLSGVRNSAAELPDGRKVYRSAKDGRLYAEDGSDVSSQAKDVRGQTNSAPSWEDYNRSRQSLEDIERRRREVEAYQRDVLDPARQHLEDEENPPSQDELNDIIANTTETMPPNVSAEFESAPAKTASADKAAKSSVAEEFMGSAELNAPLLKLDFAAAHDGPAVEAADLNLSVVTAPKPH